MRSIVTIGLILSDVCISPESPKQKGSYKKVATGSKNVPLYSGIKMTSNPHANKQSHRQRPMRPAGLWNGVDLSFMGR